MPEIDGESLQFRCLRWHSTLQPVTYNTRKQALAYLSGALPKANVRTQNYWISLQSTLQQLSKHK